MRQFVFACMLLVLFAGCKKEDQEAIDEQLILDHIAANASLAGAQRTSSGLYYVITDTGSVDHPGVTNNVFVYYTGTLLNGTRFDGVDRPSDPLELPLSYTIFGWQEGIPLFGRGGKGTLLIPSRLGYGEDGSGSIPKNAVLKFAIELVDFN